MTKSHIRLQHTGPGSSLRFLKARPLAASIGIHPKTLSRWASAGRISKFKVSSHTVFFDRDEVAQVIAAGRI